MEKRIKYIDISGVGNSGKSALFDLVREYEDRVWAPHFQFEFDLIRIPGGLIDLKYSIEDNWSQIRSDYAVKRFQSVARKMGGNGKRKSFFDLASSYGTAYQRYFNYNFHKHTDNYIKSLVESEYNTYWPYQMLDDNCLVRLYKKVCLKLKLQKNLLTKVFLVDPLDFNSSTHEYIDNLFKEVLPNGGTNKMVILNNSFEPFNPQAGLNMLKESRSIIVVRDPRDIYVSGMNIFSIKKENRQLMAKDNDGVNKSFLGTDNIDIFIKRMSLYVSKISQQSERVKVIRFEDLILNYDSTKREIELFLGLSPNDHFKMGQFLDPEKSKQNIGLWKLYSSQKEIKYIQEKMSNFEWIFQK